MLLTGQNPGLSASQVMEAVIGPESGTRSLWQKLGRECDSWPGGGGLAHVNTMRPGITGGMEGATLGREYPALLGVGKVRNGKRDGPGGFGRLMGLWMAKGVRVSAMVEMFQN